MAWNQLFLPRYLKASILRDLFTTLGQQVEDLKSFAANPEQRVRTGFDSIDFYCEGPARGEVFTWVGRSYTGKSLLATNIMLNHASSGSIFFSLEMTYRQALTRLFTQWSNIGADRVRAAIKLNRIPGAINQMASAMSKHVIVDRSGLTVADMALIIEQYADFYGEEPKFIQIDYLERIGGIKSAAEGWQATEAAADQVKDLAKNLDLPVFLYHQTNRTEPEHLPPTDKSARGGGFTEADFVVGMWNPSRDPKMPPAQRRELWSTVRMNVLKNRPSGRQNEPWRPLEFQRTESLRFRDMSEPMLRDPMAEQKRLEAELLEELKADVAFDEVEEKEEVLF